MRVSAQTTVEGEFDKLSQALAEGPANWMPGMYESPTGKITRLEAGTPLGRLARFAQIRLGEPALRADEAEVALAWQSLEAEAAFPAFDGRLRLSRLREGSNRLELEGEYQVPAGLLGRAADTAVMHRLAEATVEDFVTRIGEVLARSGLGRSVDEQVASGRLTLEDEPPGG